MPGASAGGGSFARLWGWPLTLAVLTASGLVSALVSDAWGDLWSWVALGFPIAVMTGFPFRRRASSVR